MTANGASVIRSTGPPGARARRDRHAQGLGRPRVDDELEFCRPLDGKVAGPGALEDLVGIDGEPSVRLALARAIVPIGHSGIHRNLTRSPPAPAGLPRLAREEGTAHGL